MTITEYLNSLEPAQREVIATFRDIILDTDKTVSESVGKHMSQEHTLIYTQDKVFKYALAVTKNHMTFHSMLIYGWPPLMAALKESLTKQVTFQKGCINFKSADAFPAEVFRAHMAQSARADFSSVINQYKSKKK